jgi:hypothetical protein
MILTLVILILELVIIRASLSWFGLVPSPTIVLIFIALSQIIYAMAHDGLITNYFLEIFYLGGIYLNFEFTQLFYLCVSLAIFSISAMSRYLLSRNGAAPVFTQSKMPISLLLSNVVLATLIIQALVLASVANWSIIIANREYLLMSSPSSVVGDSGLMELVFSTILFSGLTAASFSALNYVAKRELLSFVFGIIAICYFLYFLSAHQRAAAAMPIAFAAMLWMTDPSRYFKFIMAMAALALVSFMSALIGRGQPEQGLTSLTEVIPNLVSGVLQIQDIIVNFFEGIFVFGESVQLRHEPSELYKFLSFSPLPSFADGFANIREAQETRLSEYVPVSGFGELYLFGFPYNIIGAVILLSAMYLVERVRQVSMNLYKICNMLLFVSLYFLNTYPIRNAFKPLWIMYILVFVTLIIGARRLRREQEVSRVGAVRRHAEITESIGAVPARRAMPGET